MNYIYYVDEHANAVMAVSMIGNKVNKIPRLLIKILHWVEGKSLAVTGLMKSTTMK